MLFVVIYSVGVCELKIKLDDITLYINILEYIYFIFLLLNELVHLLITFIICWLSCPTKQQMKQ